MAIIIEAPAEIYSPNVRNSIKLFLAGGITGCSNWQSYVIGELSDIPNLTIYNPRRKEMKLGDRATLEQQIAWEFQHLEIVDVVLFWFSGGSLNPITLYEYGAHGVFTDRHMIVGCDPLYERKDDVEIQTLLARPNQIVHNDITDMINELKSILENIEKESF